jgi:hypothetical protein
MIVWQFGLSLYRKFVIFWAFVVAVIGDHIAVPFHRTSKLFRRAGRTLIEGFVK